MIHPQWEGLGLWDDGSISHGRLTLGLNMYSAADPPELTILGEVDPCVLFSDELLFHLRTYPQDMHPGLTLQPPTEGHGSTAHAAGQYGCGAHVGGMCYHGHILRIKTVQRPLVYKVDDYEPSLNAWWAHWPD